MVNNFMKYNSATCKIKVTPTTIIHRNKTKYSNKKIKSFLK